LFTCLLVDILDVDTRVARWHIFKPKNPNVGSFLRDLQLCWYILGPFGLFYGNLVSVEAIRYILCLLGIFSPVLVYSPSVSWAA
jgi:hypothetical protein